METGGRPLVGLSNAVMQNLNTGVDLWIEITCVPKRLMWTGVLTPSPNDIVLAPGSSGRKGEGKIAATSPNNNNNNVEVATRRGGRWFRS